MKPYDEVQPSDETAQELGRLFDKAVKKRKKLTPKEGARMTELSTLISFQTLKRPDEELFEIQSVAAPKIEYAPIFDSVNCAKCGESTMEDHVRMKQDKFYCLDCCSADAYMLLGRGIQVAR